MSKALAVEESTHSRFSPSSSPRWLNCPGSVQAIEALPLELQDGETSYAAREGTVAHTLCEIGLLGQDVSYQLDKKIDDILVTQEMLNHVQVYLDYVFKMVKKAKKKYGKKNVSLHVERHADLQKYFGGEDIGGTVDALITIRGFGVHVIDFKYGKGYLVEVIENTQLMIYGLSEIIGQDATYIKDNYPNVWLTIAQPRMEHQDGLIRTWKVTSKKLLKWVRNTLNPAIITCLEDNPPLVAGEEQCKWCPKAGSCTEIAKYVMDAAQQEFSDVIQFNPIVPKNLTRKQLRLILDNKVMMVKWLESVEKFALYELEHGKGLKGFKLVAKRSHRKFVASEQRIKGSLVARGLDVDLLYSNKTRSPNQLEETLTPILGKEEAIHLVSRFSEKPFAGVTIAKSGDARMEVSTSAQQEFSHISKAGK